MVKSKKKILDWWLIPHFLAGYVFGRYTTLEPVPFTLLNAGFVTVEGYHKKNKKMPYNYVGNTIANFLIMEGGYGIGHTVQILEYRPMIEYIAEHNQNDSLIGVEIGVWMGGNAKNILKKLPIKKLYLVDPYIQYEQDTEDHPFLPPLIPQAKGIAENRLKQYNNEIEFVVKPSSEGVNYVPNNLDFVYIDGNHAYDYVLEDIELWYPKIKVGGIIGGHDYHYHGVEKAVGEFAMKQQKIIYHGNLDWWIIK